MYRKRPGGAPEHPGAPQSTPERPRSLKLPYFYLQKAFLSEKSIQLPLFCRTKRTSEPKMPYFYLKKGPAYRRIYPNTIILPYQTHLGAENALFLPKKRARLPKNLSRYPYFAVPNAPPNAPRNPKCLIFT